jgi:hypothetical protein
LNAYRVVVGGYDMAPLGQKKEARPVDGGRTLV